MNYDELPKVGEQLLAYFRDTVPPMWWAIYVGCLQAGFDERQSFNLLQTYILSGPGGVRPADMDGPKGPDV